MLPSESQVTSVGWRKRPSMGGRGGLGCSHGLAPSSAASLRRPKTQTTRPAGLNLMIMSEPLSMAQMLSSLSMRTLWASDQDDNIWRSEEHTSELQSHVNLVCRLLLEKKKKRQNERLSEH